MSYFKNYLETIAGIGIFPIFSLCVFVVFFILLTFWVLKMSKESVRELENIPLSDATQNHMDSTNLNLNF